MDKRVVLPEPFAPRISTICPFGTWRSRESRTLVFPKDFDMASTSRINRSFWFIDVCLTRESFENSADRTKRLTEYQ